MRLNDEFYGRFNTPSFDPEDNLKLTKCETYYINEIIYTRYNAYHMNNISNKFSKFIEDIKNQEESNKILRDIIINNVVIYSIMIFTIIINIIFSDSF